MDAKKAYVIRVGGGPEEVVPKNGKDFQLEELYELTSCDMIQVVPLTRNHIMIVDEEGKIKSPPRGFNEYASALWPHSHADPIVGDVVVCPPEMLT